MSSISSKRITKLRKELEYWRSELEYIQEILKEWHLKFDEYHRLYCVENNIDLSALNKKNAKKLEELLPSTIKQQITRVTSKKENNSALKKIYKQLAKKIHPDLGGDEEEFKKVVNALDEGKIEKLLDMCDKHVILVEADEEIIAVFKKEISRIKQKIKEEKSTYSWALYSCEENEKCKEKIVKKFLKHLFNYQGA